MNSTVQKHRQLITFHSTLAVFKKEAILPQLPRNAHFKAKSGLPKPMTNTAKQIGPGKYPAISAQNPRAACRNYVTAQAELTTKRTARTKNTHSQ